MDVHIKKITQAYKEFKDVEGFAKVISNEDIISSNKSKLSLKRYVRPIATTTELSLKDSIEEWANASIEARSAIKLLMSQIEQLCL